MSDSPAPLHNGHAGITLSCLPQLFVVTEAFKAGARGALLTKLIAPSKHTHRAQSDRETEGPL